MSPDSPAFRFWIRRSQGADGSFALRYEVFEGKGVLRIARPGVLVEPTPRMSGYESDLSPAQIRASQFIHITDRRRQTWFLSQITDGLAELLSPGSWRELVCLVDNSSPHLVFGEVNEDAGELVNELTTLPPEALVLIEDQQARRTQRAPRARAVPVQPDDSASTGLIRHLRRQLAEARLQNEALTARVHDLELRLGIRDPELIETEDAPADLA